MDHPIPALMIPLAVEFFSPICWVKQNTWGQTHMRLAPGCCVVGCRSWGSWFEGVASEGSINLKAKELK